MMRGSRDGLVNAGEDAPLSGDRQRLAVSAFAWEQPPKVKMVAPGVVSDDYLRGAAPPNFVGRHTRRSARLAPCGTGSPSRDDPHGVLVTGRQMARARATLRTIFGLRAAPAHALAMAALTEDNVRLSRMAHALALTETGEYLSHPFVTDTKFGTDVSIQHSLLPHRDDPRRSLASRIRKLWRVGEAHRITPARIGNPYAANTAVSRTHVARSRMNHAHAANRSAAAVSECSSPELSVSGRKNGARGMARIGLGPDAEEERGVGQRGNGNADGEGRVHRRSPFTAGRISDRFAALRMSMASKPMRIATRSRWRIFRAH